MLKLYYRKSLFEKSELTSASKYFNCVDLISDIKPGDYVISRYGMWPFYLDQEREIKNIGAKLINSYQQYQYIADLQNWVLDLKELTPKTYTVDQIPDEGSFVVKGETNSKKGNWSKDMFAVDKAAAIEIANRLSNDGLIGSQNIYVREYVPLKNHLIGINGMPVSNEFRFFVGFGKILSGAFYWSSYKYDLEKIPSIEEVPKEFLFEVIRRIKKQSNFYVIDVAQTKNNDWIVIELNEGQQSGLSENNPDILYKNLSEGMMEFAKGGGK